MPSPRIPSETDIIEDNDPNKLPGLHYENQRGRHRCIVYEKSQLPAFTEWWTKADYALQSQQANSKQFKWGSDHRKADSWKHFEEAATFPGGSPKVRCKKCGLLLEHPYRSNQGTNSMKRHFTICTGSSLLGRRSIKQMLQKQQVF